MHRKGVRKGRATRVCTKGDGKMIYRKEKDMRKVKKLWVPVLLGVVLLVILAGVAGAIPREAASKVLSISPAAFVPDNDNRDYDNWGHFVKCNAGTCYFNAYVNPPAPGSSWTVTGLKLLVDDNNAGANACAEIWRETVATGKSYRMAQTCSTGAVPNTVRLFSDSSISYNPVTNSHAVYLRISVPYANLSVRGVKVLFTVP
jgi:hypothetical protein